jgi:hypothetical protein
MSIASSLLHVVCCTLSVARCLLHVVCRIACCLLQDLSLMSLPTSCCNAVCCMGCRTLSVVPHGSCAFERRRAHERKAVCILLILGIKIRPFRISGPHFTNLGPMRLCSPPRPAHARPANARIMQYAARNVHRRMQHTTCRVAETSMRCNVSCHSSGSLSLARSRARLKQTHKHTQDRTSSASPDSMETDVLMRTHARTRTCTSTRAHTRAHVRARARTHEHIRARARTRAHVRARVRVRGPSAAATGGRPGTRVCTQYGVRSGYSSRAQLVSKGTWVCQGSMVPQGYSRGT